MFIFFFQAEDGIRDLVRSRGLGDVYKRQLQNDVKDMRKTLTIALLLTIALIGVASPTSSLPLSLIHI